MLPAPCGKGNNARNTLIIMRFSCSNHIAVPVQPSSSLKERYLVPIYENVQPRLFYIKGRSFPLMQKKNIFFYIEGIFFYIKGNENLKIYP